MLNELIVTGKIREENALKLVIPNFEEIDGLREFDSIVLKKNRLLFQLQQHHPDTYAHSLNVRKITWSLSNRLGFTNPNSLLAAELHDIGKLVFPQDILSRGNNHGVFNDYIMKLPHHSFFSARILEYLGFNRTIVEIAKHHSADWHEIKHDPSLFHGKFSLISIVRLADTIVAMTDFSRQYQKKPEIIKIMIEIGDKFDQELIQPCLREVYSEYMREQNFPNADKIPL